MLRLELLFLMQIVMGGILITLLIKMMQMKKQVDDVIKEIHGYITFVTEEVEEEIPVRKETPSKSILGKSKENQDELQNKLIQSVLGEYFL